MSFFRRHPFPANAWPELPTPEYSLFWSAYQELNQTQWLEPEEIERLQLVQARQLLSHCREHVPYYRQLFQESDIVPESIQTMEDFRQIPCLSRQDFQKQQATIQAEKLPPRTVSISSITSSGSSGVPVTLHQTNVVQLWWTAHWMRDLEWCNIDPRGKLASIRYFRTVGPEGERALAGFSAPQWHSDIAKVIENGPCSMMDIHQDPRRQLQWLREIEPDYLLSFPSNLEFLARLVEESGEPLPQLKAIQAISETLTDEMRDCIEQGFGVPVRNTYSCAEAGYLASPCPEGHGLHVHAENVILEVLDDKGKPCTPGEVGQVFLTTLHNFQTPFIRYQIMDRAAMTNGRCACGRGLPLLTALLGKERPLLKLPDGGWYNSSRLAVIMRKVGGLHQFRITQKAVDNYQVQVVPSQEWSAEHVEEMRTKIQEFCKHPVQVEVSTEPFLERLPGGKLIDIVTEVS